MITTGFSRFPYPEFQRYVSFKRNGTENDAGQGGPTLSFPRAKNGFSLGPKSQETPPGTIFEK
jgi:hypothetical protein